jgi:ProP effector
MIDNRVRENYTSPNVSLRKLSRIRRNPRARIQGYFSDLNINKDMLFLIISIPRLKKMKNKELHPRTAIINNKQKNLCRLARLKALRWLAQRFPKAFDTSEQINPLSIGVIDEILAFADEAEVAGISKSKLRQAIVVFTRRIDYLASLKAGGMRFNLLGEVCGSVTQEQANAAAQKIKKRVEKSIRNHKKTPTISEQFHPSYHADYVKQRGFEKEIDSSPKRPEIVFKTKPLKTVDPTAVERLKSRLGLGVRKGELSEELV